MSRYASTFFPSPAPTSSCAITRSCSMWCCPVMNVRARGSLPSRWAAPAASTGAWRSPTNWRRASPARSARGQTYRECTGIWVGSEQLATGLRAVALGGGHGLAASLAALRRVTDDLAASVTVADDGGSSGRLRREFGVLPPGDLRMALAALCGDDEWGTTWSKVVQHRFGGSADGEGSELAGHAVGNLLIVALWDLLGDTVAGLDWVGRLLGTGGRVLPMAAVPLDIVAEVVGVDPDKPDEGST